MNINLIKIGVLFSSIISAQDVTSSFVIRKACMQDVAQLKQLYCSVVVTPGGLIRTMDEITDEYIHKTVSKGVQQGLALVAEINGVIVGSMIKYRPEVKAFSHVLSEGSILVHPDYQGRGIGSALIKAFLSEVQNNYPDIYRIELVARASNPAIKLYERLGFVREGVLKNKVRNAQGLFEDDVQLAWVRTE